MNIGFDLDYTLATFRVDYWDVATEILGGNKVEPPEEWNFPEYNPIVARECRKLFKMNWFMNGLASFPLNAGYNVNQLVQNGNNVYVITARHEEVRNGTDTLLRNRFGTSLSDIMYTPTGKSKVGEFVKSKIDIWVDDNPKDLHVAVKCGIKTIGVRRPWNAKAYDDGTHDRIIWVDDLQGAFNVINTVVT